jgi:hypothetical protein
VGVVYDTKKHGVVRLTISAAIEYAARYAYKNLHILRSEGGK